MYLQWNRHFSSVYGYRFALSILNLLLNYNTPLPPIVHIASPKHLLLCQYPLVIPVFPAPTRACDPAVKSRNVRRIQGPPALTIATLMHRRSFLILCSLSFSALYKARRACELFVGVGGKTLPNASSKKTDTHFIVRPNIWRRFENVGPRCRSHTVGV